MKTHLTHPFIIASTLLYLRFLSQKTLAEVPQKSKFSAKRLKDANKTDESSPHSSLYHSVDFTLFTFFQPESLSRSTLKKSERFKQN